MCASLPLSLSLSLCLSPCTALVGNSHFLQLRAEKLTKASHFGQVGFGVTAQVLIAQPAQQPASQPDLGATTGSSNAVPVRSSIMRHLLHDGTTKHVIGMAASITTVVTAVAITQPQP